MNVLFDTFMTSNQLELIQLEEGIQEKISLFWRLHEIYKEIEQEDSKELKDEKEKLSQQLEALDYEIIGDIEEDFQDRLTNNDRDTSPSKKSTTKTPLEKDISILEQLVKMKRTKNIGRHEFREMGLQTKLGWRTNIGEFTVKRNSIIRFSYDIIGV